jgi:hypothetical protein
VIERELRVGSIASIRRAASRADERRHRDEILPDWYDAGVREGHGPRHFPGHTTAYAGDRTVPVFAVVLQLGGRLLPSQMLVMLIAAVCCFWIGRILEGYASR